tara:strand:- start:126 stop:1172 length:1047 start_codon:yes stop_codon:yes gene_type:complete
MAYTTIDDPTEHFDTALWTGNGNSSGPSVSSLKFKPKFLWSKRRDATANNYIYDTVRHNSDSPNLFLNPNNQDAEQTFNAFTLADNGFTLATDNVYFNADSGTYVAWNWKGSDSSSASNSDGNIGTSTVSVNTTAGFSVGIYSGDNSDANKTVGHGLGAVPAMVIVRPRDEARHWLIWHKHLDDNDKALLFVNDAAADNRFGPDAPTSTVFGAYGGQGNRGTTDFVFYAFANIQGYSRMGSYIGNGSANGPFVHTGFKPAMVMIKLSDANDEWLIYDNKRDPINVTSRRLNPSSNGAEQTSQTIDMLSNGFKPRSTGANINQDNNTYIYYAVAEAPFVSSKGVPTTAR